MQLLMQFIDLKAQYAAHKAAISSRINDVLDHGQYIMGPEVSELETKLASYLGVRHGIGVANGTVSLEIALRALNVGPGDEVITVPFTWISSAEVIAQVGATPVFVDINASDFNLNVNHIESKITPRTKAIISVNLFGQMPNYRVINAVANRYAITVIEDAAQSFGATQDGQKSCSVTRVGSTSFFPAKPFGCYGDGGALFTNDAELAEKMLSIRTHGGIKRHCHPYLGLNGRLDTIQAAILLAKFPHFPAEVEARARIAAKYDELLNQICDVPRVSAGNSHVYAQYTIRLPNRDIVAEKMRLAGVPTAVYYPKCLHEQPVFSSLGYKWGEFPESERASREVLSLPMHPYLTECDQKKVVDALKDALVTL